MKHIRKVFTLVLATIFAFALAAPAFAAGTPSITIQPNNDDASTESVAITYTYYKIMTADIDTDPTVAVDGSTTAHGKVAYYVTTQAQATAIEDTNLFNVTKVQGTNKWYIELKDESTTGEQIAAAFDDATFLANFDEQTYTKAANVANAELPNIEAGYYFIKSSLGTKAAVQTLSPVIINEKNSYPTIVKDYNDATDALAGINDTITYTIQVAIPESVASKPIKITDTITDGLTLNTSVTVSGAVADPAYTSATFTQTSAPTATTAGVYELTIPAETVLANAGKTLTFTYTATVNENAVVMQPESNKAHLDYDNYVTTDTTPVETKTLQFDVQKVDGTNKNTILAGAEFSLWTEVTGGTQINLIDITADGAEYKTYRVATTAEAAADGFESAAIEAGQATIQGLNDTTYYLQEDVAPTGYNELNTRFAAEASESTSTTNIDYKVENNKGTELPSTGGIGTTIFYVVGGVMVVGAAVMLIAKRRVASAEE